MAQEFEARKEEMGITCFSKSYLKTLMWSHYADKHKGVCLGFRFPDIADPGLIQASVRYISSVQSFPYFKDSSKALYNWLFTKSTVWADEEEVRRLYVHKKGFFPFNADSLTEVYYGLKTNQPEIDRIHSILKRKYYSIQKEIKMKIDKSTFDLME